jgi:hypothetical protein
MTLTAARPHHFAPTVRLPSRRSLTNLTACPNGMTAGARCSTELVERPFGFVVANGGLGLVRESWHHRAHERAHRLR